MEAPSTTRSLRPDTVAFGVATLLFLAIVLSVLAVGSPRLAAGPGAFIVFGFLQWMSGMRARDSSWLRAVPKLGGARWSADESSVTVIDDAESAAVSYRTAAPNGAIPGTTTYVALHAARPDDSAPGRVQVARRCRVRLCHRVVKRGVVFETTSIVREFEHVRVSRPDAWLVERTTHDGVCVATLHPSMLSVADQLSWELESPPEHMDAALRLLDPSPPAARVELEDEDEAPQAQGESEKRRSAR